MSIDYGTMSMIGNPSMCEHARPRSGCPICTRDATIAQLRAELAAEKGDAERLDFLDASNLPMRMGWNVGIAPAGNVCVRSVIFLGKPPVSIRDAIDTARKEATK